MSSDTECETEMRPVHSTQQKAVDSLSECADAAPSSLANIRDLISDFQELDVAPESLHLPEGVVRHIASFLTNETSSLLALLAMCGVSRHWRSAGSELAADTQLSFDGYDQVFIAQPMVQRFRKLSSSAKEEVFASAANLFSGYSDACLSGDGVSDRVLQTLAGRVGTHLRKLKVQNSSNATDLGLGMLTGKGNDLEHVHFDELPKAVSGEFLVDLFQHCRKLVSVHLSSMPSLNWAACKAAALTWPELGITKLHVRGVCLDPEFGLVLAKLPKLVELEIDGPARNITAAALSCTSITRVSYQVASRSHLDEALAALVTMQQLKTLELIVKNFTLCSDQLRVVGMLPLVELRLDSFIYKQQPTLSRSSYSHVDNDGVKALVDSICNRWCVMASEMQPLKLSLCGATALTHDAVSALLRLPILTELDIGGCCRIIAMDKMRLVAKVRAGREMLESGRRPSMRNSRFPGLFL